MRPESDLSSTAGRSRLLLTASLLLLSAACSNQRRPAPLPTSPTNAFQKGYASWYGPGFQGRRTANGEKYDMHDLTAAHPTLPFGTRVAVRNPRTGRSVVVRINDRGPYARSRVIDLSYAAARAVGVSGPGTAYVELYPLGTGQTGQDADDEITNSYALTALDDPATRYTVQVGAFSEADRAVALHHEVARMYPEVFVHSDGTWNRVQVGLFQDREQAESLRRELAAVGLSSVVVAAH
jgi:rare lipoprotein A